jgi:hypothetical protein
MKPGMEGGFDYKKGSVSFGGSDPQNKETGNGYVRVVLKSSFIFGFSSALEIWKWALGPTKIGSRLRSSSVTGS